MKITFCIAPLVGIFLALGSTSEASLILFEDNFNLDPEGVGASGRTGLDPNVSNAWIESGGAGYTQASVGGNEVAQNPGSGLNNGVAIRINRTINATGFSGLQIQVVAFNDDGVQYESDDTTSFGEHLKIAVNTGSGFVELLDDDSAWQGINESNAGTEVGSDTPTASAFLALGAGADNNNNLEIQISTKGNNGDAFYLDRVTVTAIPEPSSLLFLTIGGALALLMRRRRR